MSMQGRGCMDQVVAIRQVCEKYLANGKMYSGHLWIWKRHMIRSIGLSYEVLKVWNWGSNACDTKWRTVKRIYYIML